MENDDSRDAGEVVSGEQRDNRAGVIKRRAGKSASSAKERTDFSRSELGSYAAKEHQRLRKLRYRVYVSPGSTIRTQQARKPSIAFRGGLREEENSYDAQSDAYRPKASRGTVKQISSRARIIQGTFDPGAANVRGQAAFFYQPSVEEEGSSDNDENP